MPYTNPYAGMQQGFGVASQGQFFDTQVKNEAPKKFDALGILEKEKERAIDIKSKQQNKVEQQKPFQSRDKSVRELQVGLEEATKETHKNNFLLDMKRYIDDGATLDEVLTDFTDLDSNIVNQIYGEIKTGTKLRDIAKLYPELNNIQVPQDLVSKYDIKGLYNPLGQVGKEILNAKERNKENGSFLTSNPLTQGFMGTVGGAIKGVGDLQAGLVGLGDKAIAGGKSLVKGGNIEQYQNRPTNLAEDALNTFAGGTTTIGSVFALPAITLMNAGIESLPYEAQVALSDGMDRFGSKVAQTPGLKRWIEQLPEDKQLEFKQEVASAAVGLLLGIKGKRKFVKDIAGSKSVGQGVNTISSFLKKNINPIAIAQNFNENVMGIPKAVSDIKLPKIIKKAETIAVKGSKPTYADSKLNEIHGFTKPYIRKFKKSFGIEPGQDLNNRGIIGGGDDAVEKISQDFSNLKKQKKEAISSITQKVPVNEDVTMMVKENAKYMKESAAPSDVNNVAKKRDALVQKAERGELTQAELEDIKSNFQRTQTLNYNYNSKVTPKKSQLLKNIDKNVRKFQQQELDNAGFTNIGEINKEISKNYSLLEHFSKDVEKTSGLGLADYILLAESAVDPSTLPLFFSKKIAQSGWFQRNLIKLSNMINGRTTIKEKVADIKNIKDKVLALPYKEIKGDKVNTIIAPGDTIVSSPAGNVRKGQILEINNPKNATSRIDSNSNTVLGTKSKVKNPKATPTNTNTSVVDGVGDKRVKKTSSDTVDVKTTKSQSQTFDEYFNSLSDQQLIDLKGNPNRTILERAKIRKIWDEANTKKRMNIVKPSKGEPNPEKFVSDKIIKVPEVVYRGVSKDGPTGTAKYGRGLYTASTRKQASVYGDVKKLGKESIPSNPLQFKTELDFNQREHELARKMGIDRKENLWIKKPIEDYIQELGYDGITVGPKDDMYIIKYTKNK